MQIYELAALLGMPVYKILDEMPYEEFQGWFKYLSVRPDGWKEDLRTYQIMSSFAPMKKGPEDIFGTVKAVFESEKAKQPKAIEGALPAGQMMSKLLRARGGDDDFDFSILDFSK